MTALASCCCPNFLAKAGSYAMWAHGNLTILNSSGFGQVTNQCIAHASCIFTNILPLAQIAGQLKPSLDADGAMHRKRHQVALRGSPELSQLIISTTTADAVMPLYNTTAKAGTTQCTTIADAVIIRRGMNIICSSQPWQPPHFGKVEIF